MIHHMQIKILLFSSNFIFDMVTDCQKFQSKYFIFKIPNILYYQSFNFKRQNFFRYNLYLNEKSLVELCYFIVEFGDICLMSVDVLYLLLLDDYGIQNFLSLFRLEMCFFNFKGENFDFSIIDELDKNFDSNFQGFN